MRSRENKGYEKNCGIKSELASAGYPLAKRRQSPREKSAPLSFFYIFIFHKASFPEREPPPECRGENMPSPWRFCFILQRLRRQKRSQQVCRALQFFIKKREGGQNEPIFGRLPAYICEKCDI
jgi:hypothetical protein